MERIRRVGCSVILSELAKKVGNREGKRDVNVDPMTVLGKVMKVEVSDWNGWKNVTSGVSELVIVSKCCNEEGVKGLDLRRFVNLRLFEVGDECFENVKEVKLIGLHALERVVIGKNSFRKSGDKNKNRHFYLKDCPQVKELKIGCQSFEDYSVCEIANVPSLEVIEMGELYEESRNFYWASLELKSDGDEMK